MHEAPAEPGWSARMVVRALAAFVFRYGCFAAMVAMAIWNESRPAPSLPDLVLDHVPYVAWVEQWNYVLWLVSYVPVALVFAAIAPARFCRYMVCSGVLSIVRGLSIMATGLGPIGGPDINVEKLAPPGAAWQAFLEVVNPFGVFFRDAAHIYLTKDLFFSGHTATTCLLLLYVWRYPRLRALMAFGHVLVVASLFFSHLHYTIDVIGAYGIAFSLFVLFEGDLRTLLRGRPATADGCNAEITKTQRAQRNDRAL